MMIRKVILAIGLMLVTLTSQAQLWRYVDPRIGSVGVGRTFPGPAMPFGMVKPGPDCGVLPNAGWAPMPEPVSGFSQTHVSGTGGGQKYGNILLQPFLEEGAGRAGAAGSTGSSGNSGTAGSTGRSGATGSAGSTGRSGSSGTVSSQKLQWPQKPQHRLSETIQLGYYATTYDNGIRTEMTTSERCAHYRFHFPQISSLKSHSSILIDATHFLGKDSVPDLRERQQFVGAEVEVVSDHEVQGYSRIRGGWNNGDAYTVYFCLRTDKPFTSSQAPLKSSLVGMAESAFTHPPQGGAGGALLHFADTLVSVKVGISYVSTMQARRNIDDHGFDEQLVRLRQAWETQLQKVQIEGTEQQKRMFYTALYHTMLMPVCKTGENPKWADAPYYDDYYAIWDTYRTSSPLLTLLWPERQVDIINSLLNIYVREGYMPDARSGDCNGRTQGGSNADVVIADAFVKGLSLTPSRPTSQTCPSSPSSPTPDPSCGGEGRIYSQGGSPTPDPSRGGEGRIYSQGGSPTPSPSRGGEGSSYSQGEKDAAKLYPPLPPAGGVGGEASIDYHLALSAMLKDGEQDPGADHEKHGRGGLNEYRRLGYVPYGIARAGTRTIEYAYDDYCIAQVAHGLGRHDIAEAYMERSRNWRNLWRKDYEWDDVRGYIMPRDEQGQWLDSVPWGHSKVYKPRIPYTPVTKVAPWYLPWWDTFFYEALSAEYSLSIPHDVEGLIDACGGPEAFRRRLDLFFERGRYNVGNEPSFLTPCLYHWIGRPDLSTQRIHQIIADNYSDQPDGLPGNDDGGAMSSWLVFHEMGLYPNAGQDYYLLNVPLLDAYTLTLPNGRTLRVSKGGGGSTGASGSSGASGNSGSIGSFGNSGSTGTSGSTGSTGTSGSSGNSGSFGSLDTYTAASFSVTFNGRELKNARITHAELLQGGELVFRSSPDSPTPDPSRGGEGRIYSQGGNTAVSQYSQGGNTAASQYSQGENTAAKRYSQGENTAAKRYSQGENTAASQYSQGENTAAKLYPPLPPAGGVGGGAVGSVSFTLNRQFRTWPLSFCWQGDTLVMTCKQTRYHIARSVVEKADAFSWLTPQDDGTVYHDVRGTFLFVSAKAVQQLKDDGCFLYDGITWRLVEDNSPGQQWHVRADIDGTEMVIAYDPRLMLYMVRSMRHNPLGIDWTLQ